MTRIAVPDAVPALLRARAVARRTAALGIGITLLGSDLSAQRRPTLPDSLTDREFWQFFTSMSEESGTFPSENFVSNEKTFQYVIPTLQRTLTPNGVYLGVGPEQNFTYIVNLKPRLAVIFDIRRQNAMTHLLYKALFEMSPSRADFVSRLFSRQVPPRIGASAPPADLFASIDSTPPNDSAFNANWRAIVDRLTKRHNFALSDDDLESMRHVFHAFFEAGPGISYAYHVGSPPTPTEWLVTFAQLQSLTNADSGGVSMTFLATENSYRAIRTYERKNLIVPVVGNFAGPKAIRAVGEYLRERDAIVTAFYVSNVEQYLFDGFGAEGRFYNSVSTLPIDSTSAFIRSVPGTGPLVLLSPFVPVPGAKIQVVDSSGHRIMTMTSTDSAGAITTRRVMTTIPPPTTTSTSAFISGIAPIKQNIDAYIGGQLTTYRQVTVLTKTVGWALPPR